MCGITGFCDYKQSASENDLVLMTNTMVHRGPDSSGVSFHKLHNASVGLGHRRLAILDLSSNGHQPMHFENLHIVLNGEIYNFKEIRIELQAQGYNFTSDSDTEVVLKSFHYWGERCVDKFIGMFAFCIYDDQSAKIYLYRDRAGVKPLYYTITENEIVFASELKAIVKYPKFHKRINHTALSQYFRLGYIPAPLSIYENVYKLLPAHYLIFNINSKTVEKKKYWDVLEYYNKPKLLLSDADALHQVEQLLQSATAYRMIADVPVGVFLSGGYDSSLITAIVQQQSARSVHTYTVGFSEKKYDESVYAEAIAQHLGTQHTTYICTPKDVKEALPLLPVMFDEPFADSSAIPTYIVSKMARQYVTVALSADAGDETFGGYTRYETLNKYRSMLMNKSSLQKNLYSIFFGCAEKLDRTGLVPIYNLSTRMQKLKEILNAGNDGEVLLAVSALNTAKECSEIMLKYYNNLPENFLKSEQLSIANTPLDKYMALDYITYLVDDILVKVDRVSMQVSLEGREPLLDHRIIEFLATLPSHFKIRNGDKKYLLKQLTHRYIPERLLNRPKRGFAMPVFEWLKADLKEIVNELLDENYVANQGLLNVRYVSKMKQDYFSGKKINAQKLWQLLSFQLWYRQWM